MNGQPATVVGVMPADLRFPTRPSSGFRFDSPCGGAVGLGNAPERRGTPARRRDLEQANADLDGDCQDASRASTASRTTACAPVVQPFIRAVVPSRVYGIAVRDVRRGRARVSHRVHECGEPVARPHRAPHEGGRDSRRARRITGRRSPDSSSSSPLCSRPLPRRLAR